MHTVTLLIGSMPSEWDSSDGTADFDGSDDLLNPSEEQIPAITRYELRHVPRDRLSYAAKCLYMRAYFHDGLRSDDTVSCLLVDGKPYVCPRSEYDNVRPQPYR